MQSTVWIIKIIHTVFAFPEASLQPFDLIDMQIVNDFYRSSDWTIWFEQSNIF